jgi:hypothetical protein
MPANQRNSLKTQGKSCRVGFVAESREAHLAAQENFCRQAPLHPARIAAMLMSFPAHPELQVARKRAAWERLLAGLRDRRSVEAGGGVVVMMAKPVLMDGLAIICEATRQKAWPTNRAAARRAEAALRASLSAGVISRVASEHGLLPPDGPVWPTIMAIAGVLQANSPPGSDVPHGTAMTAPAKVRCR